MYKGLPASWQGCQMSSSQEHLENIMKVMVNAQEPAISPANYADRYINMESISNVQGPAGRHVGQRHVYIDM